MKSLVTAENRRSVFTTALVLFLANLLPVIAVWRLDWTIYDLLVLYWIEVILLGLINVARMILIAPVGENVGFHLLKLAFVPFFVGHFGFFCVGLGLVSQLIFGKGNFAVDDQVVSLIAGKGGQVFWPLFIAHVFSLSWNYLGQREFRKTTIMRRMIYPYVRVVPVMVVVLGIAYFGLSFEDPKWAGVTLVFGKTVVDLLTHVLLHFRFLNRLDEGLVHA